MRRTVASAVLGKNWVGKCMTVKKWTVGNFSSKKEIQAEWEQVKISDE